MTGKSLLKELLLPRRQMRMFGMTYVEEEGQLVEDQEEDHSEVLEILLVFEELEEEHQGAEKM